MKIENKHDGKRGAFTAEMDGEKVGEMTYVYANDNLFIINYTNVAPGLNGKGIGTSMVLAAVDFARDTDCKIIPQCGFARSVFDKTKEIHDVMAF